MERNDEARDSPRRALGVTWSQIHGDHERFHAETTPDAGGDDSATAKSMPYPDDEEVPARLRQPQPQPRTASGRAAQYQREHLASQAQGVGKYFPELGVAVQRGKVYRGTGLARNVLGDLAGAFAGIIDVRRPSPMAGLFTGVPPRLGTAFVRCSNGAEKRTEIREGYVTNRSLVWRRVQQAITEFNAMADAVTAGERGDRSVEAEKRPFADEVMERGVRPDVAKGLFADKLIERGVRPDVARAVARRWAKKYSRTWRRIHGDDDTES